MTEPRLFVQIPVKQEMSSSSSSSLSSMASVEPADAARCAQSYTARKRRSFSECSTLPTTTTKGTMSSSSAWPPTTAAVRKLMIQRRHERACSAPQPASLHVNTILPLSLPPTSQKMHRSESIASFTSATSDGSWHGDAGDDDPDGQLARAIEGPLRISTYDYDEQQESTEAFFSHPHPVQGTANLPPTPTVIRTLKDYHFRGDDDDDRALPSAAALDVEEYEAVLTTSPLIARMATAFNLLDQMHPLEEEEKENKSGSHPILRWFLAKDDEVETDKRADSLPSLTSSSSEEEEEESSPRLRLVRDLPLVRPPSPCSSPMASPLWHDPHSSWWRPST